MVRSSGKGDFGEGTTVDYCLGDIWCCMLVMQGLSTRCRMMGPRNLPSLACGLEARRLLEYYTVRAGAIGVDSGDRPVPWMECCLV